MVKTFPWGDIFFLSLRSQVLNATFLNRITNNVGCPVADCAVDLGPNCGSFMSTTLRKTRTHAYYLRPCSVERGPTILLDSPLAAKSSCNANLDGSQANSPNCCTGQYSTPETCPASGVAFYNYFSMQNSLAVFFKTGCLTVWLAELNCPRAMAYAYDQASSTASWTCPSDKKADYTLTFCPWAFCILERRLFPKFLCFDK